MPDQFKCLSFIILESAVKAGGFPEWATMQLLCVALSKENNL